MPLDTDLSVSPYFDSTESEEAKGYVRPLFKPGVSVQVRELNLLTSLLQSQIERFGDAVFTIGTIINGCNFTFYPNYPYIKLFDNQDDGQPAVPSDYVGLFVKNSANLQAFVVNYADGFQSTDPDLKTLYVHYNNAGVSGNANSFSTSDLLQVFDSNVSVFSVAILNAGLNFSNSDFLVFTPAVVVNVTSGSFSPGDYVTQPTTLANLQIVTIDSTTLADDGQVILSLKPRDVDLANGQVNSSAWAVANNDSIRNATNTAVGDVLSVIGASASADVVTDGSGRVVSCPMVSQGFGYTTIPNARIRSVNNVTGLTSLNVAAQTWLANVQVFSSVDSVGNGYAFGVSNGIIYQKGYFLQVNTQTILIDKYSPSPNAVAVGFNSTETIVDFNVDPSLLDNALGSENFTAPGADRMQVTPELIVVDTGSTPAVDFFPLVKWSEGNPYLQNQVPSFSEVGDAIARGIYDTAGDFVTARFSVTTRSTFTSAKEGNTFSVVVCPGTAYIEGRKVQTLSNFVIDDRKGTDTFVTNSVGVPLNYDNWVRVNNMGGLFQFSTGDTVQLYDSAKGFLSNTSLISSANVAPVGNNIGSARVRMMTFETGIPGDPNATYKLYLFDLSMSAGQNFANVRSIAYTGSNPGITDVVTTTDATTGLQLAAYGNTKYDTLIFQSGVETLKNANQVTYTYRTIDQTVTVSNTGILTKSVAGDPTASYPPTLGSNLLDIYLVPLSNNLVFAANVPGTVSVNTTVSTMTGSGTNFVSSFSPGDYVYVFSNSTVNEIRTVKTIVNATSITLDSNGSFTGSGLAAYRIFPKEVPIPLGTRSGLSANVSSNGNLLTVNLGTSFQFSGTTNCAIAVSIVRTGASAGTKAPVRDQFIKINLANNVGGVGGPWCLGVPDVFRLKAVYVDSSNAVSTSSREITGSFYADSNQNEDFLDLSFLYLTPSSGLQLTSGQWLLARFDYFNTTSTGYYDSVTYLSSNAAQQQATDSLPLANLASSVNSFEVPEVFTNRGHYYDLLSCFDFRPVAANVVTTSSNAATAPVNPTYSLSFGNTANPANDKKFPLPDSLLTATVEQYCGRVDTAFIGKDSNIILATGVAAADASRIKSPNMPSSTMKLNDIIIPPYPNLPQNMSDLQAELTTTRLANIKFARTRIKRKTIKTPVSKWQVENQQPVGYDMLAIGKLEQRIANLEYYESLSQLETDVVTRVVPSSVDGTQNRFKFGIMVDNFSTAISQDVQDPQYLAAISANTLTPPEFSWAVKYAGDAREPYVDFEIINQIYAVGNGVNTTPNTVVTSNGVTANTWLLRLDSQAISNVANVVNLTDVQTVNMSSKAGPVAFYFIVPTTAAATVQGVTFLYTDPDEFQVYQGNTLILTASNNAVNLTAADKTFLKSNSVPSNWFGSATFPSLSRSGGFVSGSGKLTWTHNPTNGTTYTIVSTRKSKQDHWRWALNYPIDFQPPAGPTLLSNGTPSYTGFMDVQPTVFLLMLSKIPPPVTFQVTAEGLVSGYGNDIGVLVNQATGQIIATGVSAYGDVAGIAASKGTTAATVVNTTLVNQVFSITAYGLKPSTAHDFYAAGVKKNTRVRPFGGKLGDPLVTDASGTLVFNYYYGGGSVDQDVTHQFLSNTAPIATSFGTQNARDVYMSIGDGTIVFELKASNSDALYSMAVAAEADIPLKLVKNAVKST